MGKLDLVLDKYDEGSFDWNELGISVLARFLKIAAVSTAVCVLYFACDSINEFSIEPIRQYFQRND